MLTNPTYIGYLNVLKFWGCPAGPDQDACAEITKNRIVNSFTNAIFKLRFLTNLKSARFFLLSSEDITPVNDEKSEVKINGVDVITGETAYFKLVVPNNRVGNYAFFFNILLNKYFRENSIDQRAFLLRSGNKWLLQLNVPQSLSYNLMLYPGVGLLGLPGGGGTISTISNIKFPSIMIFEGMPGIPNWGKPVTGWSIWGNLLPGGTGSDPFELNRKEDKKQRESTQQQSNQTETETGNGGFLAVALLIASYFLMV